jgi:hypothetical protein
MLIAFMPSTGVSNEKVGQSPGYEVFIEPGLSPALPISRVVPTVPGPLGGGRIGGTIQSIERVALVRGQNTPSIHPDLSRQPSDVPVWVVLCRGQFYVSGPFDHSATGTRAFLFVHHKSGAPYSWGLVSDAAR